MGKKKKAKKQEALAKTSALVSAQYDAAGHGRRLRGWVTPQTGPNRATKGAATLRARARDAGRNEWAADNAATRWSVNLVGTGIVPRPNTRDQTIKRTLVKLHKDWSSQADADGIYDFYGLQNLIARNWLESGEVFVRLRWRRPGDGLAVPLQLQLLEADMVPDQDGTAETGNVIKRGIEFDRIGRRVAYHVLREHPGDDGGISATLTVRVPADQILHIYEPTRPGQLRGVSDYAPILAKLRGLGNFDDAVLHRQELANLFTAFIKKTAPESAMDPDIDPTTGRPVVYDTGGIPLVAMEPGTTQELLDGEDVVFSEPPGPGADYGDYMRVQGQQIAAGSHLPYELMAGDIRDVSDRTLRVLIQEFRRHCEQRQWLVLIPQLCEKVRQAWTTAALLAEVIPQDWRAAALDTAWVPQGWEYINPTQDVKADIDAIEAGLRTRSGVITRRGDDPEQIDEERAADQQREIDLGLVPDPDVQPEPTPEQQAVIENSRAEGDRIRAEASLITAKTQREHDEAAAMSARLAAARLRDEAEADLLRAQTALTDANTKAAEAGMALARAESDARLTQLAADEARANGESTARIAVLEEQAAQARAEAASRAEAQAQADAFVAEQRTLVLQAERTRAQVAARELEAAELGLAELRAS